MSPQADSRESSFMGFTNTAIPCIAPFSSASTPTRSAKSSIEQEPKALPNCLTQTPSVSPSLGPSLAPSLMTSLAPSLTPSISQSHSEESYVLWINPFPFSQSTSSQQSSEIVSGYSVQSKPGMLSSKQEKTNQDSYSCIQGFACIKNAWLFGVFDGHGVNGHLASDHIKQYLPSISLSSNQQRTSSSLDWRILR